MSDKVVGKIFVTSWKNLWQASVRTGGTLSLSL